MGFYLMKINCIDQALKNNPDLRVTLLIDYLRGTRPPLPNSASVLHSLVIKHPNRIQVALYHTPDLTGWKKKICPPRFNEGFGLMHMKVYIFDDHVMLSGYKKKFPFLAFFLSALFFPLLYSYINISSLISFLMCPDVNGRIFCFEIVRIYQRIILLIVKIVTFYSKINHP